MKQAFLEILRCPECSSQLSLQDFSKDNEEIENGMLVCRNPEHTYPVINHIPRFVPKENYSANFGFQWNLFKKTQLDSHSGLPISRDRFLNYSGWSPEELKGKLVLDMGCGAGR
ncbi:MAG: class I SAM-dependent methyltransferase, partial [Planctomycetes bacterium]|nr:class I SAM-dependent methyltransferase [Planctomycetota bacterium]